MHQVLQRTRPAQTSVVSEDQPRASLLRSLFTVRRGLGLLALLIGAALGSQVLHGLLFQGSDPAPPPPAGADRRGDSGASTEPAAQSAGPSGSQRAAAETPLRPSVAPEATTTRIESAVPDRPGSQPPALRSHRPPAPFTQALRSGRTTGGGGRRREPSSPPARPPQAVLAWERPSRSRQGEPAGPLVRVQPPPPVQVGAAAAAALPAPLARSAQASGDASAAVEPRNGNGVSLAALDAALDASVGLPCSDILSALPSDSPPEEAWLPLPGRGDASLLQAAALESILVPPIDSESPDRAAGPPSPSLQATRNTPCLLKQPAGRN